MRKLYLHPAKRRDKAPAGTILVSNDAEDDNEGVALIHIDPTGLAMGDDEADSLAEEICRRWNYQNG
jgi:hypothetical protein